ncbi:MAG: histidinol-phosphatase [Bacteroidetes bacterium]|nr:histidinol-phosphatase [Bacteroidota bacterium]
MYQNLHTHTNFSDGSDSPLKYIETAISQGLASLGFSDHSPLPFENTFALRENRVGEYCDTVLSLRRTSQIEIFLGMEADFIPGMGHPFSHFLENFPLDYLIGSVHLVRNGQSPDLWFIDGPDPATYDNGLNALFGGDIRKGVAAYYRQINEMLTTCKPDIVGHLDKIKMHNHGRFFSETESWYEALVDETLDLVRQSGTIVEVNTRGLYKKRSYSHFPGPDILKKIHAMKIPVIISSDAHKPAEISMLFDETAGLLMSTGFREVMNFTQSGWQSFSLECKEGKN